MEYFSKELTIRWTRQPVVDITFHKKFWANERPPTEFHGLSLVLIQRNSGANAGCWMYYK